MLTILRTARRSRTYLVYDLEWIPGTLDLRMVGVYDGNRYRWYSSIDSFLCNELTSRNRGKWFYAHAGGLADFQFVLESILMSRDGSWKIRASFSGASAIIVHVTRGKNSWHFVDSYWLLREKLRKIGKWIGIDKGNEDESVDFYRSATIEDLRRYNEIDCVILYRAIQAFEDVLLDLGGQLRMTQASCAMELFRRRFLKRDVETSAVVNDIARRAYVASRVEVITTECHDAYYYDVNSSFPYSMTFTCPGELIRTSRFLPESDDAIYIADCEIDIPECHLPPLPRRAGGRIFFPVGRWRGWFSNIDLALLLKSGGRIRRTFQCLEFAPFDDLRDYATTLYDLRSRSQGFMKIGCKYLLNSLYGKFAESDQKSSMLLNPESPPDNGVMVFPGLFLVDKIVPVPHMHVPISVHITAIARRTLYDLMARSSEVHYCDTDGFSTADVYEESEGLGGLKLEKLIRRGRFVQAKLYCLEGTTADGEELWNGEGPEPDKASPMARGKGFSRMTLAKFEKLIRGEELEYVRMARIKELVRSGQMHPREDVITKRLARESIPKRFFYPDGQSRPWTIDELASVFPEAR